MLKYNDLSGEFEEVSLDALMDTEVNPMEVMKFDAEAIAVAMVSRRNSAKITEAVDHLIKAFESGNTFMLTRFGGELASALRYAKESKQVHYELEAEKKAYKDKDVEDIVAQWRNHKPQPDNTPACIKPWIK